MHSYQSTSFVREAIDQYVRQLPDKVIKHISPSQLGGCMRSHFYKIKGLKPTTPPDEGALTNFQVGHMWEEFMAKALEDQGLLIKWFRDGEDEPFYDKELNLQGTPDLLVNRYGETVIVDSKTVRGKWFWYDQKKSLEQRTSDYQGYIIQQACYIILARKAGYDVNKAVLAFASKDDGIVGNEILIELTPELEQTVIDRCKTLNKHLLDDTLPPCECTGWKVGWCDFGEPLTRVKSKTGKVVNTECCAETLYSPRTASELV